MFLSLFAGDLYLVIVLLCIYLSFSALQSSDEEERACCFTLIVYLVLCDCWCSVALPCGSVD